MSLQSISWLDVLTIILSLYVIFECFTAVTDMPEGYQMFCQKLKYGMAFSTSAALIYYAIRPLNLEFQWLIFGMEATLTAFVWPRVVWRWRALQEALEIFADWG